MTASPTTFTYKQMSFTPHTPSAPGRIKGRINEYPFEMELAVDEEGPWSATVQFAWTFIVLSPGGVAIYRASHAEIALAREQVTSSHFMTLARYQAQCFLEEYLGYQMDAGSSARHRRPKGRLV